MQRCVGIQSLTHQNCTIGSKHLDSTRTAVVVNLELALELDVENVAALFDTHSCLSSVTSAQACPAKKGCKACYSATACVHKFQQFQVLRNQRQQQLRTEGYP